MILDRFHQWPKARSLLKNKDYIEKWIFDKSGDNIDDIVISAEPVWSRDYIKDIIWKNYKYIICLSGTILDKDFFSEMMGFEKEKTSFISLKCPFKKENRKIYYVDSIGKMSYKEKNSTIKRMIPIVKEIIDQNKHKGIIHTGNYEISNWIKEHIQNKRLLIHSSKDREELYKYHIQSDSPTILVSPSMQQGIDLYDELSRFQIIMKIPYPNLMSKKNKKRMEDNKFWYTWKTINLIVQSYGRSIRNIDDFAETYILDQCFTNLLDFNRKHIPNYFLEAIQFL